MGARPITCREHGGSQHTLICSHLRSGRRLGYFFLAASDDGPAQAWCEECQRVLDETRGWTDQSEAVADFKLYCGKCFERTLSDHTLIAEMEW